VSTIILLLNKIKVQLILPWKINIGTLILVVWEPYLYWVVSYELCIKKKILNALENAIKQLYVTISNK